MLSQFYIELLAKNTSCPVLCLLIIILYIINPFEILCVVGDLNDKQTNKQMSELDMKSATRKK